MSANLPETVLVTGASSGIGLELAKRFAADQSRLVLVARNTAALETLAAELRRDFRIEVVVLTFDLAQPESPGNIFAELSARGIIVDVLVNNAGFGAHGDFGELSLPRQLELIQVNMSALTALTGLFLPGMLQRRRGGILNVGSVAGFLPGPGMAVYFASKAYVQSFSEALYEEVRGTGVIVSVLCPGSTESNFGKVARGEKQRLRQPSKMKAAEVARLGHKGFRNQKAVVVTGASNRLFVFLSRHLPRQIPRRIIKHYNRTG